MDLERGGRRTMAAVGGVVGDAWYSQSTTKDEKGEQLVDVDEDKSDENEGTRKSSNQEDGKRNVVSQRNEKSGERGLKR